MESNECLTRPSCTSYEWIGFDVDHALVRYNLPELYHLIYESLCSFLIQEKNYDKVLGIFPFNSKFCLKGLIYDTSLGNIIKLDEHGYIEKAFHGTQVLCEADVQSIYGEGPWEHSQSAKSFEKSSNYVIFLTSFDVPALSLIAILVDYFDKTRPGQKYTFLDDLFQGFNHNFGTDSFSACHGMYFQAIVSNPEKYIMKNSSIINWLQKRTTKTFLITNSHIEYATLVLQTSLGENWRTYFDLVIVNSMKGGFFSCTKEERPFYDIDFGIQREGSIVKNLQLGGIYAQGNAASLVDQSWFGLNSKVLWFGDHIHTDIHLAKSFTSWTTVAVVEEMSTSPTTTTGNTTNPFWGCFFTSSNGKSSFFASQLANVAHHAVSTVDQHPIFCSQ